MMCGQEVKTVTPTWTLSFYLAKLDAERTIHRGGRHRRREEEQRCWEKIIRADLDK